jgi:hypothetical protein
MGIDATFWAGVSGLGTLATAIIAIWALIRQESQSRERSRPVVLPTIELRHEPMRLNFYVENYGPSAAYDVKLTFENHEAWKAGDAEKSITELAQMFDTTVPMWAPGQRIGTLYAWSAAHSEQDFDNIPKTVKGTVRYRGNSRHWYGARMRFEERFELTAEIWLLAHPEPESSDSVKGFIKKISNATNTMAGSIQQVARILGNVADRSDGIAGNTSDELELRG